MSWAVLVSGLPGSGAATLARTAAAELRARGEPVQVLGLDEIAKAATSAPVGSDPGPDVLYRVLVCMAALLTEAGVPVILDAAACRRIWRDLARRVIERFAEVEVLRPPEVPRRERAGQRGFSPGGAAVGADASDAGVPRVEEPYERSVQAELVIDTEAEGAPEAVARIVALARRLAAPRPVGIGDRRAGWAIWITGRPGSGKTTVAGRVAEALATRGIQTKVLDLATVRGFLLPGAPAADKLEELAHRTLVHATRLLTEAGVAVIVDATAPRRVWREAARELIPCFAEVQLVCPAEVCAEREQAVRWGLGSARWEGMAALSGHDAPPDIAIDYEESLCPELILHTNTHDLWTTVEQVLFLVHRLRRRAPLNLEQA